MKRTPKKPKRIIDPDKLPSCTVTTVESKSLTVFSKDFLARRKAAKPDTSKPE